MVGRVAEEENVSRKKSCNILIKSLFFESIWARYISHARHSPGSLQVQTREDVVFYEGNPQFWSWTPPVRILCDQARHVLVGF